MNSGSRAKLLHIRCLKRWAKFKPPLLRLLKIYKCSLCLFYSFLGGRTRCQGALQNGYLRVVCVVIVILVRRGGEYSVSEYCDVMTEEMSY